MASTASHRKRVLDRRHWLRGDTARWLLHLYLHLSGFIATTLLVTWGLFFLFFLAIGGFSFDGMMHQLANLGARYVAAAPDRVASFKIMIFIAHVLLTGGVILLRRASMLPRRHQEGSRDDG